MVYISGILSICPILKLLVVKLFKSFKASTVVLYFLAIEYKLSPLFTVYINIVLGLEPLLVGILSTCPTLIVSALTLLSRASSVTDTPNWLLIPYKVSPALTVYVINHLMKLYDKKKQIINLS